MKLHVYYPSGQHFHLSGTWKGPGRVKDEPVLLFVPDADAKGPWAAVPGMIFLDPRAVCVDEDTGLAVFDSRSFYEGTEGWVAEWLDGHPEWPAILEVKYWPDD